MAEIDYSGSKTCKGKAYISVFNFSNEFVDLESFQSDFLKDSTMAVSVPLSLSIIKSRR